MQSNRGSKEKKGIFWEGEKGSEWWRVKGRKGRGDRQQENG